MNRYKHFDTSLLSTIPQSRARLSWPRQCRRGVVAAEFALVCPIMLLLALAAADFGRVFHNYEIVANAARTGAETGATQQFTDFTRPSWEANIQAAVLDELQNLSDFDDTKLIYVLSTTTDADGVVRVAVDVTYPFQIAVAWPGLPAATQLHKRIEYRQFR